MLKINLNILIFNKDIKFFIKFIYNNFNKICKKCSVGQIINLFQFKIYSQHIKNLYFKNIPLIISFI